MRRSTTNPPMAIKLTNEVTEDLSPSANTFEPATHVNRVAERQGETAAQKAYLDGLEAKGVHGARVLLPKERMFDMTEWNAANPHLKGRFVPVDNKEKMEQRKAEGYVAVPDSEGGRRLGDSYVFMAIPRAAAETRVRRQEKQSRDQLAAFKDSFRETGERARHELKTRFGLSESQARRIIIDE